MVIYTQLDPAPYVNKLFCYLFQTNMNHKLVLELLSIQSTSVILNSHLCMYIYVQVVNTRPKTTYSTIFLTLIRYLSLGKVTT